MLNTAFQPWPCFTDEEIDAVSAVLRSNKVNYWTGDEGRCFEQEFANWTASKFAIVLANGTLALDLALNALQIGARNGGSPADEVIVSPRSFIASVSCVVNAGAIPVFADVDMNSGNMTAGTVRPVITDRCKAILPVHIGGWPCDMPALIEVAKPKGLKIIEDCAQAHGAKISGRSVGTFGDVGAWSFCQDKIITTGGEGGMVTCDDRELWSRMWSYKDHGKSYEAVYQRQHPPGFRWLHESVGTNWRMLEVQAVIGRIQLRRLDEMSQIRRSHAQAIWNAAAEFDAFRVPALPEGFEHAAYRAYVYVKPEKLKKEWSRDQIVAEINRRGVPCYHGSCSEIYREKAFASLKSKPVQRLTNARLLGETSLMFLVHPTIMPSEMDKTCSVIRDVFGMASK